MKIVKIEENMVKFSKFSYSKKYTTIYSSQISPNDSYKKHISEIMNLNS